MKLDFFIMTSTKENGHTEYGNTEYVIAAQDSTGNRYQLNDSVLVNSDKTDRECRDIQNRRIIRMLQAIAYGKQPNLANWTRIAPAVNSEAFNKLNATQQQAIKDTHVASFSV